MKLLITSLLLTLNVAICVAAPIDGKLSLETPVSADRAKDDSSMILGQLSTKLTKKLTLTGSAQYNFGDKGSLRHQCFDEDKVKGMLSYELAPDISIYSYYERRFSLDQDRVVVGCSYRFRVGK